MHSINIFWFRRDLRLSDNAGLYRALNSGRPVLPVFIFDTQILNRLENREDRRVEFIHQTLGQMQTQLAALGSGINIYYGEPLDIFRRLTEEYQLETVFTNHDYEPYARKRDEAIAGLLKEKGIGFQTYKDQVIFEKNEVVKEDGLPYTVFTPYSRRWKARLAEEHLKPFATEKQFSAFLQHRPPPMPSLAAMNFKPAGIPFPAPELKEEIVKKYSENRDYPGLQGTSRLGLHLRFGTLSIRSLASRARQLNETYLNELIWRDFYHNILWHFPQVGEGRAFKPAYEQIRWRNNEAEFERWCSGQTGYPIVDAGMRELNTTGFMHNRVRMIVASFLTKHLLIDWRLGEAYFAQKLLDFDLAANNGGWQWAAGSGCDAAPYFRVFNPWLQTQKFDPRQNYIRQWVPEWSELTYPGPMVDHSFARQRCLDTYTEALKK